MPQRNIITVLAIIFLNLGMFFLGYILGGHRSFVIQKSSATINYSPSPIKIATDSAQPASSSAQAEIFYQQQLKNMQEAVVTRVIDGDTIEINGNQIIRYIGIDTPESNNNRESVECFAQEAKNFNEALVAGKKVWLEKDVSETDKYGRLLRYVWSGPLMINEYLLAQGYAQIYTYPPDVKYQNRFLQAEQQARENNLGLWQLCK